MNQSRVSLRGKCAGLVVCVLGLVTWSAGVASADQSADLTAFAQKVLSAFEKGDLAAYMSLWSDKAPQFAGQKTATGRYFEGHDQIHITNLNVVEIKQEGNRATLRITYDQSAIHPKTGKPCESNGRQVERLTLVRDGDSWKVESKERVDLSGEFRDQLIGKPHPPLDVETWVNGTPLTEQDLEGKVVLLDFWAVWCGPCIATFPHLREWQQKYSGDGLVIVGLTRYYEYGWDEAAARAKRTAGISHDDERAAVVKFAEHHMLAHRLAYTPMDSSIYKQYGVTGIPQAVVIDRHGKVRLIRVGSGDANAKAVEEMIEQLLKEK